jgi:hypothetical protein
MTLFIADQPGAGAIVDVQHSDGLSIVDHEQGRDPVLVEQGQGFIDQCIRTDRLRTRGHECRGRMVEPVFDVAAKVTIGDHPDQVPGTVRHPYDPEPLGAHLHDRVVHARQLINERQCSAAMHQPAHRFQPRAECPARVQPPKIRPRESFLAHHRHGQRVAQRQRHGRRSGGRDRLGPDLRPMGKHERCRRGFGQHRTSVAGDGDHRNSHADKMVDHRLELGGLAALRNEDRDVALRRHPEIAVNRLGQVQECRRCAGRGERGRNLAPDMARLAEPADDQLPGAFENQRYGLLERGAEAVGERIERTRFVVQDRPPELEHIGVAVGHGPPLADALRRCEA